MYYEKIEEIGIDRLMDYSQERRDSILLHMPHDELVCLFHFMNVKDVRELFSADVIKDCFYNIPVEYTFPLLTECKSFYKHFLSSTDIKERIEYMSLTLFYEEMVHHYDHQTGKANQRKNPDVGVFHDDSEKSIDPDDIENRANAIAGSLIKKFGYDHPKLKFFQH